MSEQPVKRRPAPATRASPPLDAGDDRGDRCRHASRPLRGARACTRPDGRLVARAFVPGAAELEAFTLADKPAGGLARRHDAGFFEGPLTIRKRQPLSYRARTPAASGG